MARNLAVPICTRKSKIPCLSPAAYYVRRWTLYRNCLLMSKCLWSKWKCFGGLKEIASQFLSFDSWIFVNEIPDREKRKYQTLCTWSFTNSLICKKISILENWAIKLIFTKLSNTKFIFHQNLQSDINPNMLQFYTP